VALPVATLPPAGIALRIIAPRKPPYPAKDAFVKVEILQGAEQKRARGRRKNNWMEGVRKAMNERNLQEWQWEDRRQWSLGVGQRGGAF
jgi:hypothetical protein